jgi:hypothetical protein
MGYRIDFAVGGGVLAGEKRYYIFAEMAARRLGCEVRRFDD